MMPDHSRVLTFSGRFYTLLLFAYPTRFRREYGQEMAQVFRDDIRNTFKLSGPAGLVGLWFLVLFDLLKTAFAEHIWEVFHMPLEKLERWSGLAAALGGALFVYSILFDSSSNDFTRFLLILLPMVFLWAAALTGLYRRLPANAHPGKKIAFGLALFSLLCMGVGVILLEITESEFAWYLLTIGFYGLAISIAGMGIIALLQRSLGILSWVPLVLAGTFLGFIVTGNEADTLDNSLQLAFIIQTGIGWLLLGIALWRRTEDIPGPALPA